MSGINFEKIKTIANAIGAVASAGSDIDKLVTTLTGGQADKLSTLLHELEVDIVQGLQNVVNAINDERLSADWGEISSTLTYVHDMLKAYQGQLASVKAVNGQYMITADSNLVSVQDWCIGYQMPGSNTSVPGVLPVIAGFTSLETITSVNPNVSSLSGIFQDTGPGSSSSGLGANALSRWQAIFVAAKQNTSASLPGSSFIYDSVYDSILRLMSYTHNLVSLALYVHDSALALLIAAEGPQPDLQSLQHSITTHFGDYSTPGTVWHKFHTTLKALSDVTSVPATSQPGNSAYTPNQFPPVIELQQLGTVADMDYLDFCTNQVSLAGAYPNSFFSSIGFCQPTLNDPTLHAIGYRYYIALQGSVTTVGPGLTFSTSDQLYPDLNGYYNNNDNWVGSDFGYPLFFSQVNSVTTFEPSYITNIPVPSGNNHIPVITGFQITVITNGNGAFNMGLALQFGELDVSDPANPSVSIKDSSFIPQNYTKAMGYQEYTNTNQVGCYSAGGTLQYNVLTNIAFCRMNGGNVALNVQSASAFYKADFFQPDQLPAVFSSGTQASS